MDVLHIAVFVVALGFGLAQHFIDRADTPVSQSIPRWWTNGVIFAAETAMVSLFAAAITWATRVDALPVFAPVQIGGLSLVAQICILLFAQSFLQYWLHRAGHQIPLLWSWHRIHHSDRHLDATTGLRHHPFEGMLDYVPFLLLTLVLAPSASAVIGSFVVSFVFAVYSHTSPTWLPAGLDRMLSAFIITPRLHQLHHSTWQKETDTNYGTIIMVWDRLFGTYLPAPDVPRPGFMLGLDEFPLNKAQDPFLQMASPFMPPDHRDS